MGAIVGASLVIGAVYVWNILASYLERRYRREFLKDRPEISVDDIVASAFSNRGGESEELVKAWLRIAEILHVNPQKLRPEDTLEDLSSDLPQFYNDFSNLEDYLPDRSGTATRGITVSDVVEEMAHDLRDISESQSRSARRSRMS